MLTEQITLESLRSEIQSLKNEINNRNVFEEIAKELSDCITLKTEISPVIGNILNEGEEFTLKVVFDITRYRDTKHFELFGTQLHDTYHIVLFFWDNCMPVNFDIGQSKVKIVDSSGQSKEIQIGGHVYTDTGLKDIILYSREIESLDFPLELSFQLKASNQINREQVLAEIAYISKKDILMMVGLEKKVAIGNEIVLAG